MELREPPDDVLLLAMANAGKSRCRSQRGAVVFRPGEAGYAAEIVGAGFNHQPTPFVCNGSEACKANCGRTAIHAEEAALLQAHSGLCRGAEILHVKVNVGRNVPVGDGRCVRCSGMAMERDIVGFWLYHENGWTRYPMTEYHQHVLDTNGYAVARR